MQSRAFSRYKVTLLVFLGYILPILGMCLWQENEEQRLSLMAFGLLVSASGSFLFFWSLISWESDLLAQIPTPDAPVAVPEVSLEPSPEQVALSQQLEGATKELEERKNSCNQLLQQLEEKEKSLQQLKQEQEQREEEMRSEYALQRQNLMDEMEKQHLMLTDHHRTISEQRDTMERKQQQMMQLENRVRDLNYELKTLLQLAEKPIAVQETPAQIVPMRPQTKREEMIPHIEASVQTEEEAVLQLKRCLEIAQSLTGASHYGPNSRFREFSAGHYALDQRRLFDRLRTEEMSTIFVYSPREEKMLFVNDQIKLLLGLTAERFTQGFAEIVQGSMEGWKEALRQLTFKNEVQLPLIFKNRLGEEVLVDCLLGIIPTGLFRNQIIGILFSSPSHLQARSKSM